MGVFRYNNRKMKRHAECNRKGREMKEMQSNEIENDFDEQLKAMMESDSSGKKKKSKKIKKKWSKKKKLIVGGVAIAAAIFILPGMFGGGKSAPAQFVATTPLLKGDIEEQLSLNGPVSGTDSVDVVSNLHAEILEIMVKEGDRVEKDQLLATIDSSNIEKEVEMAQNAYNLAVTTYNEQQIAAENNYAKASQDYKTAKLNYERTQALYQSGGSSQVELENAKNTMDDLNRQLRSFTFQDGKPVANESYALQIKNAEFELEQKRKDLENTKVTSPISGTVVRVNSKVGRFADKTEDEKPMFIIENLDVLELKIKVSEYSIGKIQVGQNVEISADILNGETVDGEVVSISPTGEEKGGGSTERVIPITIRINDENSKLIAGITAKAVITLAEAKDTFIVPISAVFQGADGDYIAALENGNTVKLIGVEIGVESDIQTEIKPKEGYTLEEGMTIIANPNAGMTDGMVVAVMPGA